MTGVADKEKRAFQGGLVVVSGPSGSGKTTIVERLREDPRVDVAVTATTRNKREGERDGVDYFFLTEDEFRARIAEDQFVEYEEVFGNGRLYGSLKAPLEEGIRRKDRIYLLEIDVFGGLTLKRKGYSGTYVFIAPPSLDVLRQRIEGRGSETEESIRERLSKAQVELDKQAHYDEVVVNDDLDQAFLRVREILGLNATP